ncbi:ABC transporter permease/substrate-binding protein [Actinomadura parmotrematis]|uniref:Substrate-binding domain-containing protein n=1 Tax=Actinomadura parmotrematis TaxID=2864039 RepID=A0ABS7FYY1_9ACTN|nr:substrate-binding domain-containing protein [Actinomadura parmotrematis]MBW8485647.1 substrate-binding domain-containing protein [Actinomadura parmotrematis]
MSADTLRGQRRDGNRNRELASRLLGENGALVGLVVLVVVLALLSADFLTVTNLLNVGVQAAVTAVLAFGVTFVIVTGGIDLSVGAVAALSAVVLAWTATDHGLPWPLALVLAVLVGLAAGLVNGALITYGKLPPFIATLAMLGVARGLALVVSDGSPIALPGAVTHLGDTIGEYLPVPVIVMVAMGLLTALVLNRTYSGRAMFAIGGNEEAARLSGIKVSRQKLVTYGLSGAFAAVAGIVLASRLASAQPQAANGYELDAIAAVVIGGASLAGGKGKAFGTLVGALILAVLRNGLNLLSVSAFWQQVVIGVVIALAVLLDTVRRRGARVRPAAFWTGGAAVLAAVVAIAVAVAATGGRSGGSSGGGAAGGVKIGLSVSTLNNPFFVEFRDGAQAEAKKLGVALTVSDAQNDASQQVNQVQNFTSAGDEAIIINPVDSDAAAPAVQAANRADIPVVAADRTVNKAKVAQLVASDNVAGGKDAARALAKQLGGKGKIVVIQGQAGTSASRERGQGFEQGLKEFPGIQVLARQPADFDRTKGLDVMTNLLQSHPDLQGVFAENDEMALGAVKALGGKAGTQVKVVGFDGTPEGLDAVKKGTMNATVAQQPRLLGQMAVRSAVKAAQGGTLPATSAVPVKVEEHQ